jgi:hypothetical protein
VSLPQGASQFKDFCLPGSNALSLHEWFLVFLTHHDPSSSADPSPNDKVSSQPSRPESSANFCQNLTAGHYLTCVQHLKYLWSSAERSSSSVQCNSPVSKLAVVLPNQSSALIFNKEVRACQCHLKTRGVQHTDTSCSSHTWDSG